MATPPVNLGYGKQTEVQIDVVNQWMRQQPWYQQQMRAWGQDPGHPTLNKQQSQQILKAAQGQGVVVDEGNMEVDDHGNFNPIGHKLRNTLLVGGIAAATIATAGLAGAFAGSTMPAATGIGGLSATSTGLPITAGLGTAGGTAAATTGGILGTAGKFLTGGKGLGGILDTAGKVGGALSGLSAGRQSGREAENLANSAYDRAQQDQYRTQIMANNNENDFGLGRYNADLSTANSKNSFELGKVTAGLGIGDLDLRQKQFHLAAPGQRAHNSVKGDILANAKDVSIAAGPNIPIPTISGGLRPSMFSDNTRALGAEMSSQALADQRAGDNFSALPTLPDYTGPSWKLPDYIKPPNAPGVTAPVQATGLDSFLNTAGAVGSLASLFAKYNPAQYTTGTQKPRVIYDPNDPNNPDPSGY